MRGKLRALHDEVDYNADYRRNVEESLEYYMQYTLRDIQIFLQSMGKTINAYDLPQLIDTFQGIINLMQRKF